MEKTTLIKRPGVCYLDTDLGEGGWNTRSPSE